MQFWHGTEDTRLAVDFVFLLTTITIQSLSLMYLDRIDQSDRSRVYGTTGRG